MLIIVLIIILIVLCLILILNEQPIIDAVITYVDDTDPNWISEKDKWVSKGNNNTSNAKKKFRWRNNGELMYCINCIQKNAQFFRNIFIVVSSPSQVPEYIKGIDKVTIIYHKDIIDTKFLPTFNSMVIEANLYKIQNLAEYFVYFNDDCFITKPISIDSFIKNGKIIINIEKNIVSPKGSQMVSDIGFHSAWKNTNKMLDNIKEESRNIIKHIPQIQTISVHTKCRQLFSDYFDNTMNSKFRSTSCNLMNAGLAEYISFYDGKAVLSNEDLPSYYLQVFISDNIDNNIEIFKYIKYHNPIFLNIQNNATSTNADKQLRDFMKEYFV